MRSNWWLRCLGGCLVAVLATVAVLPQFARARDQDVIGIYFDQEGTITEHTTSAIPEAVIAYVVLKNLSAGVAAVAASGGVQGTVYNPCWLSLIGEFIFDCSWVWTIPAHPPLPPSDQVAVVKLWFTVVEPGELPLYILPAVPPTWGNTAVYQTTDVPYRILPLHPSSGDWQTPCAYVNRGIVPLDGDSWGSIKALYR